MTKEEKETILDLLLKNPSLNLDVSNKHSITPLMYASLGSFQQFNQILSRTKDVNLQSNEKETAIHFLLSEQSAATTSDEAYVNELIKKLNLLVKAGAKLFVKNELGELPHHLAAKISPKVLSFLLDVSKQRESSFEDPCSLDCVGGQLKKSILHCIADKQLSGRESWPVVHRLLTEFRLDPNVEDDSQKSVLLTYCEAFRVYEVYKLLEMHGKVAHGEIEGNLVPLNVKKLDKFGRNAAYLAFSGMPKKNVEELVLLKMLEDAGVDIHQNDLNGISCHELMGEFWASAYASFKSDPPSWMSDKEKLTSLIVKMDFIRIQKKLTTTNLSLNHIWKDFYGIDDYKTLHAKEQNTLTNLKEEIAFLNNFSENEQDAGLGVFGADQGNNNEEKPNESSLFWELK